MGTPAQSRLGSQDRTLLAILLVGSAFLIASPWWASMPVDAGLPLGILLIWCIGVTRRQAISVGLAEGLLVDASSACVTGTHALSFALAAWFYWEASQVLLIQKWFVQMYLAVGVTLACSLLTGIMATIGDRSVVSPTMACSAVARECLFNAVFVPFVGLVWGRQWPDRGIPMEG